MESRLNPDDAIYFLLHHLGLTGKEAMPLKIQIREYKSTDKEACMEAFKSNVPKYFTQEEVVDFEAFLERYLDMREAGATHYYVLLKNEKVLGCGGFGDKDKNGRITLAWGLLHQDAHKKGYGALLLKHRLEQVGKKHPNAAVYIDTTQHTQGFFTKFGFEVERITQNYYAKGMHRYDMVYRN